MSGGPFAGAIIIYTTVCARVYIDRGDFIMENVLLILYLLFTGEKETGKHDIVLT